MHFTALLSLYAKEHPDHLRQSLASLAAQTLPAVPSTIRGYGRPAYGASRFASRPVPTRHAGYSPSRALAACYLRGVERGIAALQTTPPPSAARRATSLLSPTAAINQS